MISTVMMLMLVLVVMMMKPAKVGLDFVGGVTSEQSERGDGSE
jgi:hypothetical protein